MVEENKEKDIIRILHVVGRMDRGGTEALLMNLLRNLNRKEIIFDFVEQTDDKCDYDEEILSLGSKIYRCDAIKISNIREYRKWWIEFLKEHSEYYIIHSHSRGSAPIYLKVAKELGRRTIAHCHSSSHGRGLAAVKRYIWQFPLRYIPEFCFACSQDSGRSQYGKREYQVILNGIEVAKYTWNPNKSEQLRKELGLENNFIIGNVARFEDPKNHEFLIDVFAEVKKLDATAKLMLVGKGSKEGMLREKIHKLGLEEDVLFMGLRSDVNELLQVMNAFVFPSWYEGMPLAMIEAQAAGLPCFVDEKAVSKDVKITNLVHFVSLEETAQTWATQIIKCKDDIGMRSDTSDDIIKAGFDIETTKEYLVGFYKSLINGRK